MCHLFCTADGRWRCFKERCHPCLQIFVCPAALFEIKATHFRLFFCCYFHLPFEILGGKGLAWKYAPGSLCVCMMFHRVWARFFVDFYVFKQRFPESWSIIVTCFYRGHGCGSFSLGVYSSAHSHSADRTLYHSVSKRFIHACSLHFTCQNTNLSLPSDLYVPCGQMG